MTAIGTGVSQLSEEGVKQFTLQNLSFSKGKMHICKLIKTVQRGKYNLMPVDKSL